MTHLSTNVRAAALIADKDARAPQLALADARASDTIRRHETTTTGVIDPDFASGTCVHRIRRSNRRSTAESAATHDATCTATAILNPVAPRRSVVAARARDSS